MPSTFHKAKDDVTGAAAPTVTAARGSGVTSITVDDATLLGGSFPVAVTPVRPPATDGLTILEVTGATGNVLAISGTLDGKADVALQVGDRLEMRAVEKHFTELQAAVNALESAGGGTPGGTSGEIQYNEAGSFGGFGSWDGSKLVVPAITTDVGGVGLDTLGANVSVSGNNSVAVGSSSVVSLGAAVAVGAFAHATGGSSVALGYEAFATGDTSVAIGRDTTAAFSGSIAIGGYQTHTTQANQIALGSNFFPINLMTPFADSGGFVLGPRGLSSTTTPRDLAYHVFEFLHEDNTDASYQGVGLDVAQDWANNSGGNPGGRACGQFWSDGTHGRRSLASPASAPADADLPTSQITFYLDESGNNLKVRVRYSDGTTLKTGTIALT